METLETSRCCWWWWFGVCLCKAGCPPSSYLMQNCAPVFKSLVFPTANWGLVHTGGISAVFWICRNELCDSKLRPEREYFHPIILQQWISHKNTMEIIFSYLCVEKIYLSILKNVFISKRAPLCLWRVFRWETVTPFLCFRSSYFFLFLLKLSNLHCHS